MPIYVCMSVGKEDVDAISAASIKGYVQFDFK
jgi:hypothetical protein